jgi:hypothetical protein
MHTTDRVSALLHACGTPLGVLPPTALYNEGWMLRLVLDAYERLTEPSVPLKAAPHGRWLSEVLLPSRFLARSRGDKLAEGWTHADGVIGHFALRPGGRGDIRLAPDATQLVVVEAKMFSPLSAGTRQAPTYNQAARNVACMAQIIAQAGVPLEQFETLAFVVLAPQSQLSLPDFAAIVHRDAIRAVVAERVAAYEGAHDDWHSNSFAPLCKRINVLPISWEEAIAEVSSEDEVYGADLAAFYSKCVRHNQPVSARLRPN